MKPCSEQEITFTVCGKIIRSGRFTTAKTLRSIREFFPASRIVLSTWENEDDDSLQGLWDEKVFSDLTESKPKIPVYLRKLQRSFLNSSAAQQTLVHAALCRVETPWAVRLRTDCYLQGTQFLKFYCKWSERLRFYREEDRIFNARVLTPWMYTRDPRQTSIAYELADGFQFGQTQDLRLLWDGKPPRAELLSFFSDHPDIGYKNPMQLNQRYTTEQLFFMNALKKAMWEKGREIRWPLWYCDPYYRVHPQEAEHIYASNILVGTFHQLGIASRWNVEESWQKPGTFLTLERLLNLAEQAGTISKEVCLELCDEAKEDLFEPRLWTRRLRMLVRQVPGVQEMAGWCRRLLKRL